MQRQLRAGQLQKGPEILGVRFYALLETRIVDQFLRRPDQPGEPVRQRVGLDEESALAVLHQHLAP